MQLSADLFELLSFTAVIALFLLSFLGLGIGFHRGRAREFELHGLLPPSVATLDEQVDRRLQRSGNCRTISLGRSWN
jgi:hypothetical protein